MLREDFEQFSELIFEVKLPVCDECEELIHPNDRFFSDGNPNNEDADDINNYRCLCTSCHETLEDKFKDECYTGLCQWCDEELDADDICSACDGEEINKDEE